MDSESLPRSGLSFIGVARLRMDKCIILAHFSTIDPEILKPILESFRVKSLLNQTKHAIRCQGFQVGLEDRIHLLVESSLIFVALSSKDFQENLSASALDEVRTAFINKASEKGIVDIEQYIQSGALNLDQMLTSPLLEDIAMKYIRLDGKFPEKKTPDTYSMFSQVTTKVESVKDAMKLSIERAIKNSANAAELESIIDEAQHQAHIFQRNPRRKKDFDEDVECAIPADPSSKIRNWFNLGSNQKASIENGIEASLSSSNATSSPSIQRSWFGSGFVASSPKKSIEQLVDEHHEVAKTNFADGSYTAHNNQFSDKYESDTHDGVDVFKERQERDVSHRDMTTLESSHVPKSVRSKSPVVIVRKSEDVNIDSICNGSGGNKGPENDNEERDVLAHIQAKRSSTNVSSLVSTIPEIKAKMKKSKSWGDECMDPQPQSLLKKLFSFRSKKVHNGADDITEVSSNFSMEIEQKYENTKYSSNEITPAEHISEDENLYSESIEGVRPKVLVERSNTGTSLKPRSMGIVGPRSNSWSSQLDNATIRDSNIRDDSLEVGRDLDCAVGRSKTFVTAARMSSVLGVDVKESGNFVYGLLWLNEVIDVTNVDFWTKKSMRTLPLGYVGERVTSSRNVKSSDIGKLRMWSEASASSVATAPNDSCEQTEISSGDRKHYLINNENVLDTVVSEELVRSVQKELQAQRSESGINSADSAVLKKKVGFNTTMEEDEENAIVMQETQRNKSLRYMHKTFDDKLWEKSDNIKKSRDAIGSSQLEIADLRLAAVHALRESHGELADYLFPITDEDVENKSLMHSPINIPQNTDTSLRQEKTRDILIQENERLKKLLEESISNLPPVPTQESIIHQRRYQQEIQSLNLQIQRMSEEMKVLDMENKERISAIETLHSKELEKRVAEERTKAAAEIDGLCQEIQYLKDTMRAEKVKAEFAVDELLESAANQVMELQDMHDLKAAEEKGRLSVQGELIVLREEVSALRAQNKKIAMDAEDSIRVLMESSAKQIFTLQENLDKSQTSIEAVTRFCRELLRKPT